MSKFKVGDRVKSICNYGNGITGTIRKDDNYDGYFVNFDSEFTSSGAHYKSTELELITEPNKPLTNTIITNIKDEAQHKRVQEKLFQMGNKWLSGENKTPLNYSGECIGLNLNGQMESFSSYKNCSILYASHKNIPASELLGEEEILTSTTMTFSQLDNTINKIINTPTEPCVGGKNKIMSNIVSFFNDLTVSAEDKELRKAGLKDEGLNWTQDARNICGTLEAKERGYTNWDELTKVNGYRELSTLELDTIFTKFYPKLLEIAKKFNRKDEEKAK